MNPSLERRIEALEAHSTSQQDSLVWLVYLVASADEEGDDDAPRPSPNLEATRCRIGDARYVRAAKESRAGFEARMLDVASEAARTEGRPVVARLDAPDAMTIVQ